MTKPNPNARKAANGMTAREIRLAATDTHKHCTKCGEWQPLSEYPARPSYRYSMGVSPQCRSCLGANARKWQLANRERALDVARKSRIKRLYGEDGVAIAERIEAGEPCETCGRRTTKMPVDHDHETGKVRGLICSNCNTTLGLVGDSEEVLLNLVAYLRKHRLAVA